MSIDLRMDEELTADARANLSEFSNEYSNYSNITIDTFFSLAIVESYFQRDFDLLDYINKNYRKVGGTLDAIIQYAQRYLNLENVQIVGINVPLEGFKQEVKRMNEIISKYKCNGISSINSIIREYLENKKASFSNTKIPYQSDSVIIMSRDNEQLRKDLQDLRARHAALEEEYKKNNALLNELRESVSQNMNQEQIIRLREQINNCEKNQNDMNRQSTVISSQIEKLESIMQKNEETRRQHEEKYIRMEEENVGLNTRNAELQKRIAELESNKKNLDNEFTRLNTEVQKNQKSKEEAEREFVRIKKTNEGLEKQIAALKREIPMIQQQFDTQRHEFELKRYESESKLREQYDARFDKLREQNRSDLQIWQTNWQDVTARNQNLVAQTQDLRDQIASIREERGFRDAEYKGAQAQISYLEADIRNRDEQIENLQHRADEYQQDYNQLQRNLGRAEGRNEGLIDKQKFMVDTTNKLLESKDNEIKQLYEQLDNLRQLLTQSQYVNQQLQYRNQNLLTANQNLLIEGNAIIQGKDKVIREKESLEVVEHENRKRVYEEVKEQGIKEGEERMRKFFKNKWDEETSRITSENQQLIEDKKQLLIKYDKLKEEKEEQEKQLIIVHKQLDVKAPVKDVDSEDREIKSHILWNISREYLIEDFLDPKTALQKYTIEEFEKIKNGCKVFERNNDKGHAIILLKNKKNDGLFYKYYNEETSKYIYVSMNPLILGRTAADTLIQYITGETRPMIQDIPRERRRNEREVLDIDVAGPILLPAPKGEDESDN